MILTNELGRKLISRRTNQFIVEETRAPGPFRALPRDVKDLILGNSKTGVTATTMIVRYQEFQGQAMTAVRCWKCGRVVMGYQPLFRRNEGKGGKDQATVAIVTLNGKDMVQCGLLPYSHFREGVFKARATNGRFTSFSYIHCADCQIKDEHGADLLACNLGGLDISRERMRNETYNDDPWAQTMYGWSGVELIGKDGPSLSPQEMMALELKKGMP